MIAVDQLADLEHAGWRPVRDYEGCYEVSEDGQVRSLDRVTSNGHRITGRVLSPYPDSKGRLRVELHRDGTGRQRFVRQLVDEAWHPARVNKRMTAKRRRGNARSDDHPRVIKRLLVAYSARIGQGDIGQLPELAALAACAEDQLGRAVRLLRERGHSWADIGAELGVTRQAAQKRWGTRQAAAGLLDRIAEPKERTS